LSCRFCGAPLTVTFADLGMAPLANSFLTEDQLGQPEPFYPLHARVCGECFLVQLDELASAESIFGEYPYFSSYSTTWLEHARAYSEQMCDRFGLGSRSQVVEVASNDGYLLQYFRERGIPVLGIEPARNVAQAAADKGIPTITEFFGLETARELRPRHAADLLIGNNVFAHVPDLNGFTAGLGAMLKDDGVLTLEFPHLLRLIEEVQFDTIYHEHFSYFSFLAAHRVLERHGVTAFDVEELSTHGGSLRVYAQHADGGRHEITPRVEELLRREREHGLTDLETYRGFASSVEAEKRRILSFFIDQRERGSQIAAYGAPAKGNTLLNFCGLRSDFISYTVDRNPHKQGRFLPGTHIPIKDPSEVARTRPDLLFVLPWNLRDEIMEQMSFIRDWGGMFILRTPELRMVA
jgi:hypothetical protein